MSEPATNKAHVMVVDDHAMNRRLVGDLLVIEGYEVTACEDAEQVQQALAAGVRPDMILMDISLPGMDGLTLTRLLKADPVTAPIPVVALTAFAMKGDEEKALAAGCCAHLAKPIDTRQLPARIARLLAEHTARPPPLNVMIVEDHRPDLRLAGDRVRMSGHVALDHVSAEEAIANLERERPDVVLLDLCLPGIDGPAFVRRIRNDPKLRALPIVVLTAYPDDFRREELLAAGCAAFLVKPVGREELLAHIEAAARRR